MFLVTTKCLAETPELSEEIKGLSLIWNFYNLTYRFPKSYILGKVILLDKKCYIYGFLWGQTLLFFSWLLDRLVLVSGEHKNPRTTQPISGFSALPIWVNTWVNAKRKTFKSPIFAVYSRKEDKIRPKIEVSLQFILNKHKHSPALSGPACD